MFEKNGEDTHVLLIFQKSGELLSKARKYIKSNNDRFYNLALDLRPGVKEQINQESDVEVQQLIDKILQVESEEELSLYDRKITSKYNPLFLGNRKKRWTGNQDIRHIADKRCRCNESSIYRV